MLLGYARGKVGSLVFARLKGQQITKAYNPSPANPRSLEQQTQRTRMGALVNFFRSCVALLNHSFCDRPISQSSYNAFISANLSKSFAWLTRSMIDAGGAVVCPYRISKGGLPPIAITGTGDNSVTNIALGSLASITGSTTIAQLSAAMVENNPNLLYGDQFSYVSFVQAAHADGTPVVRMNLYEMTLDASNNTPVLNVMPSQAVAVRNSCIAHGIHVADGGFAWIISRRTNGRLDCSTQDVILNNTTLYDSLSTDAAEATAVATYDPSAEPFLVPEGGAANPPEDTTPSVSSVVVGSIVIDPNGGNLPTIPAGESRSVAVQGGNLDGHTIELGTTPELDIDAGALTPTLATFTMTNNSAGSVVITGMKVMCDAEPIWQVTAEELGE